VSPKHDPVPNCKGVKLVKVAQDTYHCMDSVSKECPGCHLGFGSRVWDLPGYRISWDRVLVEQQEQVAA
jgi:hypothetical protein